MKVERCNDVLGDESSGNIARAICSTEKIVRRGEGGGEGVDVSRE